MGAGRIRGIKPQFFQNELLAALSPHARLAFIGLWIYADREGRLEDRPQRLRIQILPYESDQDMNVLLQELSDAGFVKRYTVGSVNYIQVVNFSKHQCPHRREMPSLIPAFPGTYTKRSTTKAGPGPEKAGPGPEKVSVQGREKDMMPSESETETESDTEKIPPVGPPFVPGREKDRTASRGLRQKLPKDFTLTDSRRAFAGDLGIPDPDREFALFSDHWRSNGKPMQDWEATWRNWCRNAAPGGRFAARSGASDPRLNQSLDEMLVEMEETKRRQQERQRKAVNDDDNDAF